MTGGLELVARMAAVCLGRPVRPKSPAYLKVVSSVPPPGVVHVVSMRSDAVTVAPVFLALQQAGDVGQLIVDAGAGPEAGPVGRTLAELGIAPAHVRPAVGPGVGADAAVMAETAGAMMVAEAVLEELAPLVVVVSGSSDAAMAWSLAASKMQIPVGRLEAGLRDRDWRDSREINRVLMDTLADALFATTADAAENLAREGIGQSRVHLTGSTAVDSLRRMLPRARACAAWSVRGLEPGGYLLVTLRRATAVDDDERLARIVEAIARLAQTIPVVLPLTDTERSRLTEMGDAHRLVAAGVRCERPLSYLESLSLQSRAAAVVTDSGTMQDEASALGVPCFTLRGVTERSVTLTHGTNALLGEDPSELADVRPRPGEPTPCAIPLWDGRAGTRIAKVLRSAYAFARVPRAS
jgi:UDP-N-acetylglucosamine 2-epimerase (non-hydrolysing)